jgi:polyhydroxybutyrate depolymerase
LTSNNPKPQNNLIRILPAFMQHSLLSGQHTRSFEAYIPEGLPAFAPLIIVLHGSGINGATMRQWTGHGLDRLADEQGFAVVYPDGYKGNWNDCRMDAVFPAKREQIDDVAFLTELIKHFQVEHGTNPEQVYVFGYSNGGHMAMRLAMETPSLVRGIAVACANLPPVATCSCPAAGRTPRALFIAGDRDEVNPYEGGEDVRLFGFMKRGAALSAQATALHFATRNGLGDAVPVSQTLPKTDVTDNTYASRQCWQLGNETMVALYTVHGGGHTVPQPWFTFPEFLGATSRNLDALAEAVRFFGL